MIKKPPRASIVWYAVFVILLLLNLFPIWAVRFPPLQDYPLHLFQSQMLASKDAPSVHANPDFEIKILPLPYLTFYGVTSTLAKFFPIEVAGRITLSAYILLIAALIIRLSVRNKINSYSWGLLLLFPLAFNQLYFLGSINYLISIPLLIFAIKDYECLHKEPITIKLIIRNIVWIIALFLTHPFTSLLYIGFSVILSLWAYPSKRPIAFVFPLILFSLMAMWFIYVSRSSESTHLPILEQFKWSTVKEDLVFYFYIFTGMRWYNGVDAFTAGTWLLLMGMLITSLFGNREKLKHLKPELLLFLASTAAVFIFPARHDDFSFINFRMVVLSYFFFAMLISNFDFKGIKALLMIICLISCSVLSDIKQFKISRETEDIVPLIQKIPENQRILPLVFNNNSPELDGYFFDPHVHDHNYYHILTGRGDNPYLLRKIYFPVRYLPKKNYPFPKIYNPGDFRWDLHGGAYRYFLVRGAPARFLTYISTNARLMATSGVWALYENRQPLNRNPIPQQVPQ